MMDWTSLALGLGGMLSTLAAGVTASMLSARFSSQHRRADIYSETLAAMRTVAANAQHMALYPAADPLAEPADELLRRLDAQIALLAPRRVREQMEVASDAARRFWGLLFLPRLRARVAMDDPINAETPEAMRDRLQLGALADEFVRAVDELENRMRKDLHVT